MSKLIENTMIKIESVNSMLGICSALLSDTLDDTSSTNSMTSEIITDIASIKDKLEELKESWDHIKMVHEDNARYKRLE